MRIATFNVNGIRAAERRGFPGWLAERTPDVLAVQEMRCPSGEVPDVFAGYHLVHDAGMIAGRNGVALATRTAPSAVRIGFGSKEFDREGRYVEVDLDPADGPLLRVASVYVPKGGTPFEDEASLAKMQRKFRFLRSFARHLSATRREAAREGREFVVMGDWNIAPTELDLRNWRTNRRSEGFLPEEREWIAGIQSPRTLVDVVRHHRHGEDGPYSWWSWRGKAFDNDAGWRIDYQLATPRLARSAIVTGTDRDLSYDTRISDHAPVVVDYDV
ncbi:exodeoxyribonuclease III [Raineyella fluvialis]|uniref:Exodeoxyribonuclease III n=1 Tax=Raineyella fluvialis TaxID=2662261 RepID=A0A5Q2FL21_9ACTN|nr:exodeoxyribonuclease III [Raineyella fluvialis]QGF25046.1 exodeoxyribonuclease III [Raineyella fluvialis]